MTIDWHHLLGLVLMDLFEGSDYDVELEKDLTFQEQYLDILIIRKSRGQPLPFLPDGLEGLRKYNLLTFKSLQEPLNSWTVKELIGSLVIYRKQISPSPKTLLPSKDFKLYAVSARYPQPLAKKVTFKKIKDGIYDVILGIDIIRLIVTSQLDKQSQNALWLFFSGREDGFAFGESHYKWRDPKRRGLLNPLYERYLKEGIVMPYTWENFEREYIDKFIESLPPKVRLKGLSPEVVLGQYSPKVVLGQYSPAEVFKQYPLEDRMKGLPSEVIEKYLAKLKKQ